MVGDPSQSQPQTKAELRLRLLAERDAYWARSLHEWDRILRKIRKRKRLKGITDAFVADINEFARLSNIVDNHTEKLLDSKKRKRKTSDSVAEHTENVAESIANAANSTVQSHPARDQACTSRASATRTFKKCRLSD